MHGLTNSVARVIEVNTWHSVDAVCHCCLTHGSCHWTNLFWLQWWGLPVAHVKKMARVLSSVHASTGLVAWVGPTRVQHTLAGPVLYTYVLFVWCSVAWGSVTFWQQSYACNWSMFCMWTRSGSPHNVKYSLNLKKGSQWEGHLCQMFDPVQAVCKGESGALNWAFLGGVRDQTFGIP